VKVALIPCADSDTRKRDFASPSFSFYPPERRWPGGPDEGAARHILPDVNRRGVASLLALICPVEHHLPAGEKRRHMPQ